MAVSSLLEDEHSVLHETWNQKESKQRSVTISEVRLFSGRDWKQDFFFLYPITAQYKKSALKLCIKFYYFQNVPEVVTKISHPVTKDKMEQVIIYHTCVVQALQGNLIAAIPARQKWGKQCSFRLFGLWLLVSKHWIKEYLLMRKLYLFFLMYRTIGMWCVLERMQSLLWGACSTESYSCTRPCLFIKWRNTPCLRDIICINHQYIW